VWKCTFRGRNRSSRSSIDNLSGGMSRRTSGRSEEGRCLNDGWWGDWLTGRHEKSGLDERLPMMRRRRRVLGRWRRRMRGRTASSHPCHHFTIRRLYLFSCYVFDVRLVAVQVLDVYRVEVVGIRRRRYSIVYTVVSTHVIRRLQIVSSHVFNALYWIYSHYY
jgi:hypothetical protein